MLMVVGLGNPGKQHETDRHNIGFMVVDRLAMQLGAAPWKTQCQAMVTKVGVEGQRHLLVKPQTYVNLSGIAVAALLRFYRVPHEHCLVVSDDLDLPLAAIRQRNQGSDGGHKGLRSIIQESGSRHFKRLRIGIGRPTHKSAVNTFVLGGFGKEGGVIQQAIACATQKTEQFLLGKPFENESVNPDIHPRLMT